MDLAIDQATLNSFATWLAGLPKPVGIVACCDEFGRYCIEACGLAERAVPEQVAVLGIDQNSAREGYLAAQLVADMLDGKRVPPGRHLVPPASVIERNSTAFIVTSDPYVIDALASIHANVHAIMLLVTTDLPLKVIAKRSGFRYPQYMTNVFTRTLGITPALVRQRKAAPVDARQSLD
jgi:ABC-type sugar transport system substrate-binding protein